MVPPLVDKSWAQALRESRSRRRARPASWCLTPSSNCNGRAIYMREGCWYCHTQQTRTLLADTKRSRLEGRGFARSPLPTSSSTTTPHMFGTKRTGPDLSRVGGKYDTQWHRTHFRNPRDLVPGSVMPPFPWIVNNPTGIRRAGGLPADAGPRQGLASGQRLREVRRSMNDYTYPSIYFAYFLFFLLLVGGASSSASAPSRTATGARTAKSPSTACFDDDEDDHANKPATARRSEAMMARNRRIQRTARICRRLDHRAQRDRDSRRS